MFPAIILHQRVEKTFQDIFVSDLIGFIEQVPMIFDANVAELQKKGYQGILYDFVF